MPLQRVSKHETDREKESGNPEYTQAKEVQEKGKK